MSFNKKDTNTFSLSQAVNTLKHKAEPDGLYIEDILATFGSRGHALLIVFFSIPFIQPLPLLGLSTPLGFIMMILGIFLCLDKRPWLPRKLLRRHVKPSLVLSCCGTLSKILQKTERLIRPRYGLLIGSAAIRILNGTLIFIFAFLLSLPLPVPFSNSIPAYFLLLNAISLLEGDGALLLLSYVVALGGAVFFFSLGFGAVEIFDWILLKI